MIDLLRKVLLSPWLGYKWSRAVSLAASGDVKEALEALQAIAIYYQSRWLEFHLLRSFLYLQNAEPEIARRDLDTAKELIERGNRYTDAEKAYLACYASTLAHTIEQYVLDTVDDLDEPPPNYDDVNLSKVRKALKRNFPLPNHPKWEVTNK